MEQYVLFNETVTERTNVRIDMEDRGYLFGDGIYEVVFVYNWKPFALKEHFTRFEQSAAKLEMKMPYSVERFYELTHELITKNSLNQGIVYIQMTRGSGPRNHLYERNVDCVITGFARQMQPPTKEQTNGIAVLLTDDIRWLRCDIKSLNLLGNTMAKRKAADCGCAEAILHRNGTCTEGSSSNLFIVKNNVLRTHPANHFILNGITRQFILKIAEEQNITVREEAFTTSELKDADEVFISSTTQEVTPVISVKGDIEQIVEVGPVTLLLQEKLKEKINKLRVTS